MGMNWDEYFKANPTDRFGRTFPLETTAWERTLSLVGRIASNAADAESLLGTLASVDNPGVNVTLVDTQLNWDAHGTSGKQLIKLLHSLSDRSSAVKNITDRYEAWVPVRNQIIHGSWLKENHETGSFELWKPNKGFQKRPSSDGKVAPYTVAKLEHADLVEIGYAFYSLSQDTRLIVSRAMAGAPIESWPYPNFAPESQWWPPST